MHLGPGLYRDECRKLDVFSPVNNQAWRIAERAKGFSGRMSRARDRTSTDQKTAAPHLRNEAACPSVLLSLAGNRYHPIGR